MTDPEIIDYQTLEQLREEIADDPNRVVWASTVRKLLAAHDHWRDQAQSLARCIDEAIATFERSAEIANEAEIGSIKKLEHAKWRGRADAFDEAAGVLRDHRMGEPSPDAAPDIDAPNAGPMLDDEWADDGSLDVQAALDREARRSNPEPADGCHKRQYTHPYG